VKYHEPPPPPPVDEGRAFGTALSYGTADDARDVLMPALMPNDEAASEYPPALVYPCPPALVYPPPTPVALPPAAQEAEPSREVGEDGILAGGGRRRSSRKARNPSAASSSRGAGALFGRSK